MSLQGREELQSVYSMVWRKLGGKSWCGGIEHSRWPWKIVFDMWPHLGKGVLRWKAFKCVFTSNMFKRRFNVSLCRFNASLMHLKTTMCLKCPNVLTRFNVPIIITFSCQNIISQIINPGTPLHQRNKNKHDVSGLYSFVFAILHLKRSNTNAMRQNDNKSPRVLPLGIYSLWPDAVQELRQIDR